MTTRRTINVELGKQGFQERRKAEPENLNLAQSADTQFDALVEARDVWTTRLNSLAQESLDIDLAFIAEKTRETRPDAIAVRVRVQYDSGNLAPDGFQVLTDSGFVRIHESDDDYEAISEMTKILSRRNRQHIWRNGRGPLGGPAYISIDLQYPMNTAASDNLGVRRSQTLIAITEAEGEVMRAETTLAAIALRDVGLTEVRYTAESSFDGKTPIVKATDVIVAPGFDRYYTRDSARQHAAEAIMSNMGTNTLGAVIEHQAKYKVASVIDRYDTEYNPLEEN